MSTRNPIGLVNFFVYNSSYGPREGEEHKKILYYHPPDVDMDTKIKNVGLCEAVVKFTETFTDKPCESVHTQKTRQLFYQPEPEFWVVVTVSIPFSQKTKDGQSYIEYHEEDVHDSVFEAVLQQSYKMFRLFMGTFYHILEKSSLQGLKQRLDHFYSRYLLTLRLNHSDLLDVFNGIHFLPLDKNTYLRIQCFINALEATFPSIKYTAFLYNDQLVWSGLEQEDMRMLYRYLNTSLFPSYMEQEFHGSVGSPPAGASTIQHYGKYITGPTSLNEETVHPTKVPRVYVNTDISVEECHLVVYKALSASVCMLIDGDAQLTMDEFRRLDTFLGPQLSALASDISDQYARRTPGPEPQFKYIYFNHMNLAEKTTVHSDSRKTSATGTTPEMLRLIADISYDLEKVTCVDDGETIVKTCNDCWVVGKKSDQREFYVIITQKSANLIEINEEVKRLCAAHFSNIFFLD